MNVGASPKRYQAERNRQNRDRRKGWPVFDEAAQDSGKELDAARAGDEDSQRRGDHGAGERCREDDAEMGRRQRRRLPDCRSPARRARSTARNTNANDSAP